MYGIILHLCDKPGLNGSFLANYMQGAGENLYKIKGWPAAIYLNWQKAASKAPNKSYRDFIKYKAG